MTTLPFTDKTEYIAWRTQWRADYAALSTRIRDLKKMRKDKDAATRCSGQWQAAACRKKAFIMLEDRKRSKAQAQAQFLAAKAAAPVGQI